ncbi:4-hydroxy-tetrahydrodipicolinate synthase [Parageobacillus thermoglucosidasius]|uniref:4-hydroxy-tetrahydrodipicolinate synthase n=2 Tax=Parageobacillus thermoglucosidasius TaxID=1426 RepID=A0AAN0YSU2_PARTM|nr:4-hydroxy-tetrahydrodipicolinate synthase [Parageobacillus thermoglucosidasius]REK55227.1 MAG: 4-hydroxy-tetrahydrodipicolinate synthase [Geobacillus sp.]ALF12040.1 4-hydroxy-tetrahydrodipicolinate synthase [Parageobacillus thermoglucosidasius]ANZ32126.1 4-hydroxy-tetrahydrodipicolinate synthase [Parageobacillus thermoglucosidasius]APM81026.1 4-hydroxy-tetrahydrodipicolinate synthase [Parageobacillus thermoglucosidasius]EID43184.1 dihydrodipicolinate synthase [Parageobacillus thermoglucosid
MVQFGKIVTAMVTPFDRKGNVDFAKTTKLIDYLLENGTDSLVVAGTTGESPTLTAEEKIALFRHVVSVVNGRVPVIAGTGSNNTRASIELTKKAEEIGVDAVMLVAPYYNKPNQEGLYQHFKAIAESTSLPVMLYNIPGRSVVNIAVDTIVRLSEIPNIVAVKDASGNLDAMTEIIARTRDDFLLYSGDDSITLPVLSIGGAGVVSVASHIIGNEMQQMIAAFEAGEIAKAAKLHQKLLPIMKGLFAAPSPVPVKTALQLKGLDVGSVRLPLVPLTEQERIELMNLLNTL